MDRVIEELKKRGLPYVAETDGRDTVIVFAVGYTPFLYLDDEFEIGAFYPASHEAYRIAKSVERAGIEGCPNADYKGIAERQGLGFRAKNDLIYTPEYGTLCALGGVKILGKTEQISRQKPENECENCGFCTKNCPNNALIPKFNYERCLRRQMDDGIENGCEKFLQKSVLGCNLCSEGCIKNKVEKVRPPEIFQEYLKIDNFLEKALQGRRALAHLGDIIGHNMIRPARMLTLATYALQGMDEKYLGWLDRLGDYPDKRVKRAVEYVKSLKNYK